MSEIHRILDQMDRAFSGDAWHGPSLMSVLDGVRAEEASLHPIHGAHSIWELVHHVAAWNTISQHRLAGETVEITTARDWPPVYEVNEAAWKRALESLRDSRTRLRDSIKDFGDEHLQGKAAGPDYTRYVVLHGVIQHDLYHAGQIVMLKKALAASIAASA
jgi:uncharacterized damage-inducible protein DinB